MNLNEASPSFFESSSWPRRSLEPRQSITPSRSPHRRQFTPSFASRINVQSVVIRYKMLQSLLNPSSRSRACMSWSRGFRHHIPVMAISPSQNIRSVPPFPKYLSNPCPDSRIITTDNSSCPALRHLFKSRPARL